MSRPMSPSDFTRRILEQERQRKANNEALAKINKNKLGYLPVEEQTHSTVLTREQKQNMRAKFVQEARDMLLSECIYKLLENCLNVPTIEHKAIARNMVNTFVKENGSYKLLKRFGSKNLLLAEYAYLVNKYYHQILESTKESDDEQPLAIDVTIKDNFFDELDMTKPEDVIVNIRNRVTDAVQDFINRNTVDKIEIQDIIKQVQDRVAAATSQPTTSNPDDDAAIDDVNNGIKESYIGRGKEAINRIKRRSRTVYETMFTNIAEGVLKNEQLRKTYLVNNKIDLQRLDENCQVMYTFLEMLNLTGMADIDSKYIYDVLESVKSK